jgi:hypothetical protein
VLDTLTILLHASQAEAIIYNGYVVPATPPPPSLIVIAPLGLVEFIVGIVKYGETAVPF